MSQTLSRSFNLTQRWILAGLKSACMTVPVLGCQHVLGGPCEDCLNANMRVANLQLETLHPEDCFCGSCTAARQQNCYTHVNPVTHHA